ncbi:TetR/AcrR family transcriptional regulator [Actinomycetes bacterium M1A6_2h]
MPKKTTARNDMLRSAALLFRERGAEATSVADVLDHAGAPRGSVYYHFPRGRPQLVEEATQAAGKAMGAMISASLSADGPAKTLAMMIAVFRGQLIDTDFAAGCPIGAVANEGPNTPAALTAAGESFTSWEESIAASLWQNGIALDRSRAIATLALSAIEGALLLCKAQRTTHALDRVETELSKVLANAAL